MKTLDVQWEAVLLAGGKPEKDFAGFEKLPSKAFIPILGRRMADYILDVLRSIPRLRRIVSVVPPGTAPFPETAGAAAGNRLIDSLAAGFEALLPDTGMVLVVTCDLPCLNREGVEDFMVSCESAGAGLNYSYVLKSDSEQKFPGIPHTYIKLAEATVCGGGLIGIVPARFPRLRDFADQAAQHRKSILKLGSILGFSIILKFLLKRLSVRDAEQRASRLLGFPAKGILSRFPEIAFNVDDLSGLRRAEVFLSRKVRTLPGEF